ncbi:MAG: EAL domain-containing protein [Neomegalonema sp.]|nr:EAL domain-containing protein [Neomegalonema sp.]
MIGRLLTSNSFPLMAAATGAVLGLVALLLAGSGGIALAVGAGLFAALLSIRNWWVSEDERPLLAEELLGVHDSIDLLRSDANDLRKTLETGKSGFSAPAPAQVETAAISNLTERLSELEKALDARAATLEGKIDALGQAAENAAEAPAAASPVAATEQAVSPEISDELAQINEQLQMDLKARVELDERVEAVEAKASELLSALNALKAEAREGQQVQGERLKTIAQAVTVAVAETRALSARMDGGEAASFAAAVPEDDAYGADEDEALDEADAPDIEAVNEDVIEDMSAAQAPEIEIDPADIATDADQPDDEGETADEGAHFAQDAAPVTTPRAAAEAHAASSSIAQAPEHAAPEIDEDNADALFGDLEDEGRGDDEAEIVSFNPDLVDGRFELMLQPIFASPAMEPTYFEAYTRLRDEAGDPADVAAHIDPAKREGTILLVDNILFNRSVGVVEELRKSNGGVAVFCNLSIQTLRTEAFLMDFLKYIAKNRRLGDYLVLEFSQDDIGKISEADLAVLARIRDKGFRFSLDHITDWTVDIERMAKIGFKYLKLDSADFLARVAQVGGSANKLLDAFDRLGLELIVEKIQSDAELDRVTEAGARFVQGNVLAAPRPMRAA